MNLEKDTPREIFDGMELRGYDEFSFIEEQDKEQAQIDKLCCQAASGSCVITVPTSRSLIFIVGILGKWMGTLNVLANTEEYPFDGEHELGHVVTASENKIHRISYKQLLEELLKEIIKFKNK